MKRILIMLLAAFISAAAFGQTQEEIDKFLYSLNGKWSDELNGPWGGGRMFDVSLLYDGSDIYFSHPVYLQIPTYFTEKTFWYYEKRSVILEYTTYWPSSDGIDTYYITIAIPYQPINTEMIISTMTMTYNQETYTVKMMLYKK
ncbi:MAG: hypothetical protein ACI3ZQ_04610 [Candidatus Cryptobacteroides sp.]